MIGGMRRLSLILFTLLVVAGGCRDEPQPAVQPPAGQIFLAGQVWDGERVRLSSAVVVEQQRIVELLDEPPQGALQTGGLILPGLIELHEHIRFGYAPRFAGTLWPSQRRFENRYQWQAEPLFRQFMKAHDERAPWDQDVACAYELYGETRRLVGGTTSLAGGVQPRSRTQLARNLDGDLEPQGLPLKIADVNFFLDREGLLEDPPRVVPSRSALDRIRGADLTLLHLAEGRRGDPLTRLEFEAFLAWAKKEPEQAAKIVPVHLVGLEAEDFGRLRELGIQRAVWSPSSNMTLYGQTMMTQAALDEGFTIALGTDWYPSGSDSLFDELRFAKKLVAEGKVGHLENPVLNAMITEAPAAILGLERLGRLAPSAYADLIVIPWKGDLEASLEYADVDNIKLVLVDGEALYGERLLMRSMVQHSFDSPWRPSQRCYSFDIGSLKAKLCEHPLGEGSECVPVETLGERFPGRT